MDLESLFKGEEIKRLLETTTRRTVEARGKLGISGMTDDSRKVKPGFVFVAIKGREQDGHDYIRSAVAGGAVVIVYQDDSKTGAIESLVRKYKNRELLFIKVSDSRRVFGLLWAAWYDFPSKNLKIIGVTGTDGKTTTTNLIYHILHSSGKKVGMVSTINARIGEKEIDTGFHVTNPEPELLQKLLKEMVVEGLEYAVLEVTSHGINQERIAGVNFYGAVMTNVTHEHLDYHKNFRNYLKTKGRIFENVRFSILNKDDKSFSYLNHKSKGKKISYGIINGAGVLAKDINQFGERTEFRLSARYGSLTTSSLRSGEVGVRIRLPGIYNVYNALAATATVLELGITLRGIKKGLESFGGLEGRFEEVNLGQPFKVVVDFAHTPNALDQVLRFSQRCNDPGAKIIIVFGCAGERDKEKRPMMGEIAARLADWTVITAEDPRREKVNDIIDSIASGCRRAEAEEVRVFDQELLIGKGKHTFVRVPDRREAIELAVSKARSGDLVLITGKGHEKSMCFGEIEYPWSDRKAVEEALDRLGYKVRKESGKNQNWGKT